MFNPPQSTNVLDNNNGFCAITKATSCLWRPARVLKLGTVGTLIVDSVKNKDFYQTNNDCTSALYKLPGYRYPVKLWWDNTTGNRVA